MRTMKINRKILVFQSVSVQIFVSSMVWDVCGFSSGILIRLSHLMKEELFVKAEELNYLNSETTRSKKELCSILLNQA